MSQTTQSPNEIQEQFLNLQEELSFQLALLGSIDDSVSDSASAEWEIREKIRELQAQFKTLKLSITAPTEMTELKSTSLHSESTAAFLSHADKLAGYYASERPFPSESKSSQRDQESNPRKRDFTEYFSDNTTFCGKPNFKRLTPNTSSERSLIPHGSTFIDLDGIDDLEKDSVELLQKQQKSIEERIRMEKLDEEYARKLQEEMESFPNNRTIPSTSPLTNSSSMSSEDRQNPPSLITRSPRLKHENGASLYSMFSSKPSQFKSIRSGSPRCNENFPRENHPPQNPKVIVDVSSTESEDEVEIVSVSAISPGKKANSDNEISRNFLNSTFPDNHKMITGKNDRLYYGTFNTLAHFKEQLQRQNPSIGLFNRPGPSSSTQMMYGDIIDIGSEISSFSGSKGNLADSIMKNVQEDHISVIEEGRELALNIARDAQIGREETPVGLVHPLYEHQKIALSWLKAKEESKFKGAILADDMGLGKTVSALALILSRRSTNNLCKTTLIVGPVALIHQWEREIRVKVKQEWKLSTIIVHGSKNQGKKIGWDTIRNFDIVLTTYGTLAAEYSRYEKCNQDKLLKEYSSNQIMKDFPLVGSKSQFYRIILDEAQSIRNKNTITAKACFQINAIHRICLSGTPMMNSIIDLYSLIKFLRIKPYNEWFRFDHAFSAIAKPLSLKSPPVELAKMKGMESFQALLKGILLRRTKNTLIDGKPIITLPPKHEEIHHVVFDDEENAFYRALEQKTQIQFNKYLAAGSVGRNYSSILVLLLRLRQACCHPSLVQNLEPAMLNGSQSPEGLQLSEETMINLAKSLSPEVVHRLLNCGDAFECPICYDGVENPRIIIPCGHDTCAECFVKITDQQSVASDNGPDRAITGKCPSCRGILSSKNVIDYVSFKKAHIPGFRSVDDATVNKCGTDSDSDSDSETEDEAEPYDKSDLRNFVQTGSNDIDKSSSTQTIESKARSKGKGKASSYFKSKSRESDEENSIKHLSLAMLKQEANKSSKNRRRYMKYLKAHFQPSAKIIKCMVLIRKFLDEKQKVIIFSQFVSLLDLLEIPIHDEKWKCLRYDGSMGADARHDAVQKFYDTTDHNIMLISLKAGNAGLNLVAASRVIILDPFWNPFIEMQAVDRAYRIGQLRPVEVHRILIQNTVEDRIIELQEKKRQLVDVAFDENAAQHLGRLDSSQLAFLFGQTL